MNEPRFVHLDARTPPRVRSREPSNARSPFFRPPFGLVSSVSTARADRSLVSAHLHGLSLGPPRARSLTSEPSPSAPPSSRDEARACIAGSFEHGTIFSPAREQRASISGREPCNASRLRSHASGEMDRVSGTTQTARRTAAASARKQACLMPVTRGAASPRKRVTRCRRTRSTR